MPQHKLFRKILTALQLSACSPRPYYQNVFQIRILLKIIAYAFYEGCFRTNYHQVDGLFNTEFAQRFKIINGYRYIGGKCCCAGISGCDKQLIASAALAYFPGEGMLTASITNNENIHGLT